MAQKRKRAPNDSIDPSTVFKSDPIEDRSSTFIGYFSPTASPRSLQDLPEIRSASHKTLAWRVESKQRALTGKPQYDVDHDDDGEKYGGKKVEKVLESMQVVGACVVARWYGGAMLGPVRFEHMERCAREAVRKWLAREGEERARKRRVEMDAVEKRRLEGVLAKRDESILVLRALAVKKERRVKEDIVAVAGQPSSQIQAPAPVIDYSVMPLDRLKALEKARDATLSFLLKRIDKAEAGLKPLKGTPQDMEPQ
ncbi:ribosomal protein S5 domain 2-like protein [Teratosphaeria nubilosa]|uniref:Ribosomal protein S5 domain 2-like protein n=1 Tax=Teratosphaeria nubilosa TaxID=161662 RepID=A0A6G1LJW1_9PEZI|nr:ribosomal protein S5 domain 2-like protein [Teratosphaeria nubilosa]